MSEEAPVIQRSYPRSVTLRDGTAVGVRLMTPADAHRVLAFARALPEDDLLFLRVDITKAIVVMLWGQNIKAGLTVSVLAEKEGEVVGYAALHHNEVSWQRKVNFYKVNTDEEQELGAVFGIRSIPSLLFIPKEGQPKLAVGALPKESFKSAIEKELLVNEACQN